MWYVRTVSWVGRVFSNGPGALGLIPGRVMPMTLKMVLDTSFLTLSNIRYVSRVKWSNPGKGLAPSFTHRCSTYWKRSLWVTLDYGRQLYLLTATFYFGRISWSKLKRFLTWTITWIDIAYLCLKDYYPCCWRHRLCNGLKIGWFACLDFMEYQPLKVI